MKPENEWIEVGDWVEPRGRELDPREVAKIEGDQLWLYLLTDKPAGPFPINNYLVERKAKMTELKKRLEIRRHEGKLSANLDDAGNQGVIPKLTSRQAEDLALFLVEKGWRKP